MSDETNNGTDGGLLKGKPHYDKNGKPLGGIKAIVTDTGQHVELEGGEVIINKEASKKHWKELSKINQSAGGGVPIVNPADAIADTEEYLYGGAVHGKKIEFNPNHLPNKWVYEYAKKIKTNYPKVWALGGNEFGDEAFNNLERALERGHWTKNEEWMYVKWQSFNARHKQDFRIAGVIANLKWLNKVENGWDYMKNIIEKNIDKLYGSDKKLLHGGEVTSESEKNKLKLEILRLTNKSFKMFPSSPAQKKVIQEIDTLREKLKKLDATFETGDELKKGIEVEKEHISTAEKLFYHKISPEQAPKSIAKEHLKEDPQYYTKLNEFESKLGLGGTADSSEDLSAPLVGGTMASSMALGGGIDNESIKGITEVTYEDNGDTLLYGQKNSKTRISVKNSSQKDIEDELNWEKKMLEKQKADLPNMIKANDNVQNSLRSSLKEKDDSRKLLNMATKNIEILEKIVIPFYQSKLLKQPTEQIPEKPIFDFMKSNPMGQARAITVLEKRINADGQIKPFYKWIESFDKGLVVQTDKIYSSKSEKGYTEKPVIGDHIVHSKAEQDYYVYLENGGEPYSTFLERKKIYDDAVSQKEKAERDIYVAEQKKKQKEQELAQNIAKNKQIKDYLENGLEFVLNKYKAHYDNVISSLEKERKSASRDEEIAFQNKMKRQSIENHTKNYIIASELYKLENGEVVKKHNWKVGDKVLYDYTNEKPIETVIENIRDNGLDEEVTYIVEKRTGIYNQYIGYDGLFPLKSEESANKTSEPTENIYTYAQLLRPFDTGTYEKENFIRFVQDDRYNHGGYLEYSKPLSIDKMKGYDLAPISEVLKYDNKEFYYYENNKLKATVIENNPAFNSIYKNIPAIKVEYLDENNNKVDEEIFRGLQFMEKIASGKFTEVTDNTSEPEPEKIILKNFVGKKVLNTRNSKQGIVTKAFKPNSDSSLKDEPYIVDIKYDDGTTAINMPIGDKIKFLEDNTSEPSPEKEEYNYNKPLQRSDVDLIETFKNADNTGQIIKFEYKGGFFEWRYSRFGSGSAIHITKYVNLLQLNNPLSVAGSHETIYNTYNESQTTDLGKFLEFSIAKWNKDDLFGKAKEKQPEPEPQKEKSFKERINVEKTAENFKDIRQSLDEFFTPKWTAQIMFDLAIKHGFKGGSILEPSFGHGVFFDVAIENSSKTELGIKEENLYGFEIYKPNFEVVKKNHPKAKLFDHNFEYQFIDQDIFYRKNKIEKSIDFKTKQFDLVLGNPPYGKHTSPHSFYFDNKMQIRYEGFFIWLALQKVKKGGLVVFIINSLWLQNGNLYNHQKEQIAKLGDLIDAYRLPNKTFKDTDIATDIVVFRKK